MNKPITGNGNSSTFDLVRMPNGVYLVDGRTIPVTDNAKVGGGGIPKRGKQLIGSLLGDRAK